MKATVVVDNIKNNEIPGEWGLCISIEYEDKKILLDTGASTLFSKNAEKLGISLKDVDAAVLSHAHYDHANGMEEFFKINSKAKFYLRNGCAENCYGRKWIVRRHIVGGANRTLISAETPPRSCRIGTCRRLSAG